MLDKNDRAEVEINGTDSISQQYDKTHTATELKGRLE